MPGSAQMTIEPTENQCDWTAAPSCPVSGSLATIEYVLTGLSDLLVTPAKASAEGNTSAAASMTTDFIWFSNFGIRVHEPEADVVGLLSSLHVGLSCAAFDPHFECVEAAFGNFHRAPDLRPAEATRPLSFLPYLAIVQFNGESFIVVQR